MGGLAKYRHARGALSMAAAKPTDAWLSGKFPLPQGHPPREIIPPLNDQASTILVVIHLCSPISMVPTEDQNGLTPKELPSANAYQQGRTNSRSELSADGQPRLVDILADMLRSALNWEEEHDVPPHKSPQRLSSQPRSVDCPTKARKELLGRTEGGTADDGSQSSE